MKSNLGVGIFFCEGNESSAKSHDRHPIEFTIHEIRPLAFKLRGILPDHSIE